MGDYFLSGGADHVCLAWKSNMNPIQHENIEEIQAKIETEVFQTVKERVDKLPSQRGTKLGANKESKAKKAKAARSPSRDELLNDSARMSAKEAAQAENPAFKAVNGVTYRKLKPEVKKTLEKVVYQLELISKTLQLMETRVVDSEDKLQDIMTYIKASDIEYVSLILHSFNIFVLATKRCQPSNEYKHFAKHNSVIWKPSAWRREYNGNDSSP